MPNSYFKFKQFTLHQEHASFRITTDSVLLGAWADITNAKRILDIGTGTGLLALMAAQRSNALITAIEPDEESFNQAVENIRESKWNTRITLVNCQIQDFNPADGLPFDAIITNPPFFTGSLLNPDPRKASARHSLSLSSNELLMAAGRLLAEEGTLNLVLPVNEGNLFMNEAISHGFFCYRLLRVRPASSQPPKRLLISMRRTQGPIEDQELVIERGGRHEYSAEYISLTGDFYPVM